LARVAQRFSSQAAVCQLPAADLTNSFNFCFCFVLRIHSSRRRSIMYTTKEGTDDGVPCGRMNSPSLPSFATGVRSRVDTPGHHPSRSGFPRRRHRGEQASRCPRLTLDCETGCCRGNTYMEQRVATILQHELGTGSSKQPRRNVLLTRRTGCSTSGLRKTADDELSLSGHQSVALAHIYRVKSADCVEHAF
jgi:hypothetical protein